MGEVVSISPDLKHDIFGVEEFLLFLKQYKFLEIGVTVNKIYEWFDNCVGVVQMKM